MENNIKDIAENMFTAISILNQLTELTLNLSFTNIGQTEIISLSECIPKMSRELTKFEFLAIGIKEPCPEGWPAFFSSLCSLSSLRSLTLRLENSGLLESDTL